VRRRRRRGPEAGVAFPHATDQGPRAGPGRARTASPRRPRSSATCSACRRPRERHQVVFSLPGDALLEVFGPGDPDHDHFSTGPVVGFFVDDIEAARDELERAGVELLGPLGGAKETGQWAHFRAPDGNVYELTARPASGHAAPEADA
jgi:catechol 2,3-dioxygenase-like lactoylglutathione lyase family enzyme